MGDDRTLTDSTIVITGASSGFGRGPAISHSLFRDLTEKLSANTAGARMKTEDARA